MAKKLKMRVHMKPLSFAPGAERAKEREIDVIIDDTGAMELNLKQAKKLACVVADCNRLNYAFSVLDLALDQKTERYSKLKKGEKCKM